MASEFRSKTAFLALGPIVATLLWIILPLYGFEWEWPLVHTAAVTAWVAIWWVTEPIPIPATSLIPLAGFPLLGVLPASDVASAYGSDMILLMLGGFLLSAGIEQSGAHRRIALNLVRWIGSSSAPRLVIGFMLTSALLSMWISNAATSLMLLPIAMAVVEQSDNRRFQTALLLGVAYGASIGGIGTPIGTPPNLIFVKNYEELVGVEIAFFQWMTWVWPIVLLMLAFAGAWLSWGIGRITEIRLPASGRWKSNELRALAVFGVTAMLWVTRSQPWGGWSHALGLVSAKDANIAILGALALFLIPGGSATPGQPLLRWERANQIPWGILILFAGGICIAKAFVRSGLSGQLGELLAGWCSWPVLLLVLAICLAVTFLTEITSNTATATILMPILGAASLRAEIDPLVLMVPATISASFAFMLPVATPPNAIVFSANRFTTREMARAGLGLNLIGAAVVAIYLYWRMGSS